MGVFKWLRRERLTVTTSHVTPEPTTPDEQRSKSATKVGTIRTEEYKRDLAEFQARRSLGTKESDVTPVRKKCSRHSLPISCTDCAVDHDNTFNYEKKSAIKYKKKTSSRNRTATSDENTRDGVPKIQFLFQNQVFMPGNILPTSYSEPQKSKRCHRQKYHNRPSDPDFVAQRRIDFAGEDRVDTPELYKYSLPINVNHFLNGSKSDVEEVDGVKECDVKVPSQNSSNTFSNKNESGDDKLWEVMSELKNFDRWADEQLLQTRSPTTKTEDSKSETSAYGLPIASASNIDVSAVNGNVWSHGKWGVVPVQVKRLAGVCIGHVKNKLNTEINILSKCRHPNIILLMGLYPDVHNNVNIVCERFVDTLYGILHVQGRILTAQMSVSYALDVANALVFLRMQGYIHGTLSSESIVVTANDAAKLADLSPCLCLPKEKIIEEKPYDMYSPEPQYVNIEENLNTNATGELEPLLSQRSSETYLTREAVRQPYDTIRGSKSFRWHSPELFQPDEEGFVYACSKSDVYSLTLILWECCNASLPWKTATYEKLKEMYVLWKTGIRLPQDGTYPGSLLSLLQNGLKLQRNERPDLAAIQDTLQKVKRNIDDLEYIVVPARLTNKKSDFSSVWDTNSPTDSECLSPQELQHKAVVHKEKDSSTESEKDCSKSDASPLYEVITTQPDATYAIAEKCFLSDEDQVDERPMIAYKHLTGQNISSACSTPIAKIKARFKDIGTPGALHRSDSTEYCSILSPNRTTNLGINHDSKDSNFTERPTAKLSRSFTPQSYKPLHIKVPEFNLDSMKPMFKEVSENERSSYNFDIKNYSLPTTPIARSNKLRKNAWLSGDFSLNRRSVEKLTRTTPDIKETDRIETSIHPATASANTSSEKELSAEKGCKHNGSKKTPLGSGEDSFSALRREVPQYPSSPEDEPARERSHSWSFKSSYDRSGSGTLKRQDDTLANVNVRPLVAIHERWIYEANRKTGRSMSLPESNKITMPAFKPASHCVDTLQNSLPPLHLRKTTKVFRAPGSPGLGKNEPKRHGMESAGAQWEQFCQARDAIARGLSFGPRADTDKHCRRDADRGTSTEELTINTAQSKVDQATDTRSIEEFIREMIRKEFQHLIHEISDDTITRNNSNKNEEIDKGVANILENLKGEGEIKKDSFKSFSRVKINGNNKPLLQITFNRSGENSLQVLDNCVNVTICEASNAREKLNQSTEDAVPLEDGHVNSLKRCQAFSAIQEARSTEDLYIDDDISAQMQENFGGRVKLIPLHGSLHEILCEKEDECCLIKVKQENGCDTIYFHCDNSDAESRDAIDGADRTQDTVVFKRSISLVEERVQRIFPKEKRAQTPVLIRRAKPNVDRENRALKIRPKSEVFTPKFSRETRILSSSSPSLYTKDNGDEVEVNIESVLSYQDSSSDECIKCHADDDFELLEKTIEDEFGSTSLSSMNCGCLEKISEENLSVINE